MKREGPLAAEVHPSITDASDSLFVFFAIFIHILFTAFSLNQLLKNTHLFYKKTFNLETEVEVEKQPLKTAFRSLTPLRSGWEGWKQVDMGH